MAVKRNHDGAITNAAELTCADVVGQRVVCPACGKKVLEKWPLGWDEHSQSTSACSMNGATPEERQDNFKQVYRHLFR